MGTILLLLACILLCEAVGILGAIATARSVQTWYKTLKKPWFSPPSFLFAPVWTLLYILMGIALFLLLRSQVNRVVLILFAVQLVLNLLWPFLFFFFRNIFLGLIEIIVLFLCIAALLIVLYPTHPLAALLLLPYALWVLFASILNAAYYVLNK